MRSHRSGRIPVATMKTTSTTRFTPKVSSVVTVAEIGKTIGERQLLEQCAVPDEGAECEVRRVEEERPQDDPDQEVHRVVLEAEVQLEETPEDRVENGEVRKRLRDRPDISE